MNMHTLHFAQACCAWCPQCIYSCGEQGEHYLSSHKAKQQQGFMGDENKTQTCFFSTDRIVKDYVLVLGKKAEL